MIHCSQEQRKLVEEALKRITYKPGWKFEIIASEFAPVLVLIRAAPDASNPNRTVQLAFQKMLPDFDAVKLDIESYFFEWLSCAIMEAEQHEAQEWFRVDGKPFHVRIQKLS